MVYQMSFVVAGQFLKSLLDAHLSQAPEKFFILNFFLIKPDYDPAFFRNYVQDFFNWDRITNRFLEWKIFQARVTGMIKKP